MVAKGLPSVVQRFIADAEDYLSSLDDIIDKNRAYIKITEDSQRAAQAYMDRLNGESGAFGKNAEAVSEMREEMAAYTAELKANIEAMQALAAPFRQFVQQARDAASGMDEASDSADRLAVSSDKASAGAEKASRSLKNLSGDTGSAAASVNDLTAATDKLALSEDRIHAKTQRLIRDQAELKAARAAAAAYNAETAAMAAPGGSGGLYGNVATQLAAAAALARAAAEMRSAAANFYAGSDFTARGGAGPGSFFGLTDRAASPNAFFAGDRGTWDMLPRGALAGAGGGSRYPAVIPPSTWLPDSGGGGSALAAALAGGGSGGGAAALLAGGRGGGGGGAGALMAALLAGGRGGGGDGAGALMTAAGYAAAISGFVGRWATAAHYVVMGTLEALSTILPASIAGGAAAAVGTEAGQQLYGRGQALYQTNEAFGGGGYAVPPADQGVFSNTLQAAQDKYGGGVYALAGGAIQLAAQGGGAFAQMGGNTLSMLAHALASAQVNMTRGGTLGQLQSVLGGGTNYLREFGATGANLGSLLLGAGQHLPGVGADWLAALTGLTGAAAGGVRAINAGGGGSFIGGTLAGEAGWRLGTPLLGLAGKGLTGLGSLTGFAGRALGGVGWMGDVGLTAKDIAAMPAADLKGLMSAAGVTDSADLLAMFGSGAAGGLGTAGAALGALTGPVAAAASVGAFLVSQAWSPRGKGAVSSMIGGYQGQVAQAPFADALTPIAKSLGAFNQLLSPGATGYAPPGGWGTVVPSEHGVMGAIAHQLGQEAVAGQLGPAATAAANTLGNIVASGPQLITALNKMGVHGETMAQAMQLATNALITVPQAFGGTGAGRKLSPTALQQLSDYVSAMQPMGGLGAAGGGGSYGAFSANVAAQQIFSSGKVKDLQTANQAMDSAVSLMTGGPVGMASLFGLLGGAPVAASRAPARAGIQLSSPPPYHAMAQALTSFTSAGGAAAWQTFAGQNGLVPAEQANLDQIRSATSLGALSGKQGTALAAFQLQQLLPLARHSPAALATLMSMGAGAGIPNMPYYSGPVSGAGASANQAKEYIAAENATGKIADNVQQANAATSQMAVNFANLPKMAQQFSQSLAPDVQSQQLGKAASALAQLQDSLGTGAGGKPTFSASALQSLVSDMQKAGGGTGKEIASSIAGSMKTLQFPASAISAITSQVAKDLAPAAAHAAVKAFAPSAELPGGTAGTGKPAAASVTVTGKPAGPVHFTSTVSAPPTPKGGVIHYIGEVTMAGSTGGGGGGGGAAPPSLHFLAGVIPRFHSQHGMLVPGAGSGDTAGPFMLEPGELVVPKHLVPSISPGLAGKIPGLQDGSLIGLNPAMSAGILPAILNQNFQALEQMIESLIQHVGADSGGGSYGGVSGLWKPFGGSPITHAVTAGVVAALPKVAQASGGGGLAAQVAAAGSALPMPSAAQQVISAFEQTFAKMSNPWGNFASQVLDSLLDSVKNPAKETAAQAKTLTGKVSAEVGYAQSISSAASAGLGLSSMQVPTPTMTAQGQPYQYYIDQSNVSGGGAPPSVQGQMGDYLQALKSFSSDIKSLGKQGLSKALLQQLLSAGPIQGDAEAQSIMGGAGGAKGANKLWQQIQQASNQLGISGATAVYGQPKGKSVDVGVNVTGAGAVTSLEHSLAGLSGKSVNVHVNLTFGAAGAGGGGGGGGGVVGSDGTINLGPALTTAITKAMQKDLLQQAQRNRRTGLTLPGRGSLSLSLFMCTEAWMLHVRCPNCGAGGETENHRIPDAAVHCTSLAGDPPGSTDGCCSALGHTHEEHIAHVLITGDASSRPVIITAYARLEGDAHGNV